ncbi:hypothetical protein VTK26DRAFT_2281 [Humicola hyalothermophila]
MCCHSSAERQERICGQNTGHDHVAADIPGTYAQDLGLKEVANSVFEKPLVPSYGHPRLDLLRQGHEDNSALLRAAAGCPASSNLGYQPIKGFPQSELLSLVPCHAPRLPRLLKRIVSPTSASLVFRIHTGRMLERLNVPPPRSGVIWIAVES